MDRTAPAGSEHRLAVIFGLAVLLIWGLVMAVSLREAALEDQTSGMVLAVFPPGTSDVEAFQAIAHAGGSPVRATWLGFAWVVEGREDGYVGRLKDAGMLAAFGEVPLAPAIGGCVVITDDKSQSALRQWRT